MNLTLEDVTFLSPEGRGVRKAFLSLDLSSLNLSLQVLHFEAGDFPVQIEARLYDLGRHPQGKFSAASPRLDPFVLSENLKVFAPFLFPNQKEVPWARAETFFKPYFPKLLLENFSLAGELQAGKLAVSDLSFQAFGGDFDFQGETGWPAGPPRFSLEGRLERGELASYSEALEGNLFFKAKFEGEGKTGEEVRKNMTGAGTLSLTNGDWHSLDILDSLSRLEPFKALVPGRTQSTPFHDLKASWNFQDGKFTSQDFLLLSDELWVEGDGNLDLEGTLNGRLEVYLSKALTKKVLDSWGEGDEASGKQLGPVPLLLVGKLAAAKTRADDRLLEPFLEAVGGRRYRKILHEPFKESKRI